MERDHTTQAAGPTSNSESTNRRWSPSAYQRPARPRIVTENPSGCGFVLACSLTLKSPSRARPGYGDIPRSLGSLGRLTFFRLQVIGSGASELKTGDEEATHPQPHSRRSLACLRAYLSPRSETLHEGARDQVPAVHQHEKDD